MFFGVLLDYVLVLASRDQSAFASISGLQPHLIALVNLNPITAAGHFIAKVTLMQKNLVRGLARGATNAQSRTYPGAPELTILRLVGSIWSTSDFSHPVVAPTVLLMGQYLGHGRLRSTSDLGSGLMLCSLLAQVRARTISASEGSSCVVVRSGIEAILPGSAEFSRRCRIGTPTATQG